MKSLIAVSLFLILAPQACRTVKGPATKECPKGEYTVFEDKDTVPPTLSYVCKEPAPSPSPTAVPASPEPTPSPSAVPSAVPSSVPSPSPSSPPPSASPSSSPSASPECVADAVKLGFRASVPKQRGYRNTFDVTPMYRGQAIKPETNCGPVLIAKYGEFQRFQTSNVFAGRHSVEKQSDNEYILVDATNSDDVNWAGGRYTLAGSRTFCVSWPHLPVWRCQDGQMTDRGQLVGFGENNRGYDLSK